VKTGPYPSDLENQELYCCKVEKYNNSIKDRKILSTNDKEQGFTFIMRDAKRQFIPKYNHTIKVKDYRFENQLRSEEHTSELQSPTRRSSDLVKTGPYPSDLENQELYCCKVEKYNNSIKDRKILSTNDKEQGFTFIMRDAKRQFIPKYNHTIKVKDYRFENQL